MGQDGFHLSVVVDFGERYETQSAAADGESLIWTPQAALTNIFGTVKFTDPAGNIGRFRFERQNSGGFGRKRLESGSWTVRADSQKALNQNPLGIMIILSCLS